MEKFRILTLNNIADVGLARFPASKYEVGAALANPDAILVRSGNMHEMDIAPAVKAIGRAGAGTNNIPVSQMSLRGVPVFNAPGANANAVKELVIAGMLMAARNLLPATCFVAELDEDDDAIQRQVEDRKKDFAGIELPGHTLGVIGLGKPHAASTVMCGS
jgi:D-3-phosphoglycerate dehydrogenase / 2-oxoglutarate reductase